MSKYRILGKSSIVLQIFSGMLLVCLIPLLIIGFQGYHCSRQAIMQLQSEALNAQVHSKEIQIRNWLDERKQDLFSLANNYCGIGSSSKNEAECCLVNLATAKDKTYEELYLYDSNWKLLNHYPDELEHSTDILLTATQKKHVAQQAELVFSAAHVHIKNTLSIHVACKLMYAGKFKGFAVAVLNATRSMKALLKDDKSPYIVRIMDNTGDNILTPQVDNKAFFSKLPIDIRIGTQKLQFYTNESGIPVVGVSRIIYGLDWIIIIEAPVNTTFRWLPILQRRAVLTGLASLILTLIIAILLANSITRPFKELVHIAREISSGNTKFRAEPWGGKEQRDLAIAFNEMLDSLERLQVELTHQSTLATIGQLTSSIVHEMRNPLSSISMNIHALRQKVASDPLYEELAQIAQQQTDRLEHLLNELLKFGKPIVLNRKYVAYSKLINFIKQDAEPILHKTSVRLHIENLSDTIGMLYIDTEKIRHVFSNLIANAVQACKGDGDITVSIEVNKKECKIIVKDTGSGIPTHLMTDIFYPFVTGYSNGTGLGLANVKKIVELHGGTISAANLENGGAEFIIVFAQVTRENKTV